MYAYNYDKIFKCVYILNFLLTFQMLIVNRCVCVYDVQN